MKNAFECYEMYLALKSHFGKASYDYFKYNGKMNVSVTSFDVRKDKFHFTKLAKHKDPEGVLISNFICKGPDMWIGDIDMEVYMGWLKVKESLFYTFTTEIENLNDDLESNFTRDSNGCMPDALKLFFRKKISIETLSIIADLMGLVKYWDAQLGHDPSWEGVGMRLRKYIPFVRYDKKKFKDALRQRFAVTA